jgi:hypothetical protein
MDNPNWESQGHISYMPYMFNNPLSNHITN